MARLVFSSNTATPKNIFSFNSTSDFQNFNSFEVDNLYYDRQTDIEYLCIATSNGSFANSTLVPRTYPSELERLVLEIPTDEVTDAYPAIQAAIDKANELQFQSANLNRPAKNLVVNLPQCRLFISQTIVIKGTVTLRGETNLPYPIFPSDTFASMGNTNSGTTILPMAGFTGEHAIVIQADNATLEGCIVDGSVLNYGSVTSEVRLTTAQGKVIEKKATFHIIQDNDTRWALPLGTSGLFFMSPELPAGEVNVPYECNLHARQGSGNYTWSINGSLPPGITFSNGRFFGTATAPFEGDIQITLNDGVADPQVRTYKLVILSAYINTTTIQPFTQGILYPDFQLEAGSVTNPAQLVWTWDFAPAGMSLSTDGIISGTPTESGTFAIRITLTDNSAGGATDVRTFDVTTFTSDDTVFIDNQREAGINPILGEPVSAQYRAHGGIPTGNGQYIWRINVAKTAELLTGAFANNQTGFPTATQPCEGVTLSSDGVLSGTPTLVGGGTVGSGVGNFVLECEDGNGDIFFIPVEFNLRTEGARPELYHHHHAPMGKVGEAFDWTPPFESIPSAEPYTFELIDAPAGLSINPTTGQITGVPVGADFVNGVDLEWSSRFKQVCVRNFWGGAGIHARGPMNLALGTEFILRNNFYGMFLTDGAFDSKYWAGFIAGNMWGIVFGPGAAGVRVSDVRVEFSAYTGIFASTASDNQFTNILIDTSGWQGLVLAFCREVMLTGVRAYRNGRTMRGTGVPLNNNADPFYSCGFLLRGCHAPVMTGCMTVPGSDIEGQSTTNNVSGPRNFMRQTTSLVLFNSEDGNIVGNALNGCSGESIHIIGNLPEGFVIEGNTYNDENFHAFDKSLSRPLPYTLPLNGNFNSASNGDSYNIVPVAGAQIQDTVEGWRLFTDGTGSTNPVTEAITVERFPMPADSELPFNHFVLISKDAEPGATSGQLQNVAFLNRTFSNLRNTSKRLLLVSFWMRSKLQTPVFPIIRANTGTGGSEVLSFFSTLLTPPDRWRRYSFTVEVPDLRGLSIAEDAFLQPEFLFNAADQDVDISIGGVLVQDALEANFIPGQIDDTDAADIQAALGIQPSEPLSLPFGQPLSTGNGSFVEPDYLGVSFDGGLGRDVLAISTPGSSDARLTLSTRDTGVNITPVIIDKDVITFPFLPNTSTNPPSNFPENTLGTDASGNVVSLPFKSNIPINPALWNGGNSFTIPAGTHRRGAWVHVSIYKDIGGGQYQLQVPGVDDNLSITLASDFTGLVTVSVGTGGWFGRAVIW